MYFDGSFTLNGARGGVVLISPKEDQLLYVIWLHFHVTNNVVEYKALVNGLCITVELGVQRLYICSNSELIINQVMEESNYRDSRMVAYRMEVRRLEEKLDGFELHHILRWDDEVADALTRLGSSYEQTPSGVFTHDLYKPSIRLEKDIPTLTPGPSLGEDSLVLMAGTPSGKGGTTPAFEVDLGTSARPIGQDGGA
jgi:ribonuclease HI